MTAANARSVVTRRQLAEIVARKAGISRRAADRAIRVFLAAVTGVIRHGITVELVGFGRFGVRWAKARTGRNMKTGRPVRIPAGRRPFFKPGKELKAAAAVSGRKRGAGL
ncbi:MAG: HU family DNA-binding protein, partial [candidate division WOR-3 bacterium]